MNDDLVARLAEVAAAMDRLLARVDEMHAGQRAENDVLRRDILGALGKTRADIMGKVVELQGQVMAISDDIAVEMGETEEAQRAVIEEEYRGYNLTAVRRRGMWQVSIYPLSMGQIVPKPRGRRAAQAAAREEAFIEARRRVDALLAGGPLRSAGSSL
jgi:hypothetical protein